jgi:hypothetical protein
MVGVDVNNISYDRTSVAFMLDILQQNILVTNNYMAHTPSERYMNLRCEVKASHLYSKVPCT